MWKWIDNIKNTINESNTIKQSGKLNIYEKEVENKKTKIVIIFRGK